MNNFKNIGLTILLVLNLFACQSSKELKESHEEIKNNDSITETNDWYQFGDNEKSKKIKILRANGKIGFLYENGEELFPCIFDSVVDVNNSSITKINGFEQRLNGYFTYSSDNNRYAKVKINGKWGIISIDGSIVIPYIYDEIYDFDYSITPKMEGPYIDFFDYKGKIAIVKKNNLWGLVNTKGEVLTDFIYEQFFIPNVRLYHENRAAAMKNGKWGFLNEKGELLDTFIYDAVGSSYLENPDYVSLFKGGLAVVKKNGKWGAIDLNGNERISFIYENISTFNYETTSAQKDGKWGYINKNGEEIIPLIYDDIKWFEIDLCPAKNEGLWGFINTNGEYLIPAIYENIKISNKISIGGGLWFFSQDGYCAVKKQGKWGLIDKNNNVIVGFDYDSIEFSSSGIEDWAYYAEGFLAVKKGKFWSVINKKGVNYIPFKYDDVAIWSEGNICIKKNGKWGLLDSIGKQLVPIEYKNAMEAGNLIYKTKNDYN